MANERDDDMRVAVLFVRLLPFGCQQVSLGAQREMRPSRPCRPSHLGLLEMRASLVLSRSASRRVGRGALGNSYELSFQRIARRSV